MVHKSRDCCSVCPSPPGVWLTWQCSDDAQLFLMFPVGFFRVFVCIRPLQCTQWPISEVNILMAILPQDQGPSGLGHCLQQQPAVHAWMKSDHRPRVIPMFPELNSLGVFWIRGPIHTAVFNDREWADPLGIFLDLPQTCLAPQPPQCPVAVNPTVSSWTLQEKGVVLTVKEWAGDTQPEWGEIKITCGQKSERNYVGEGPTEFRFWSPYSLIWRQDEALAAPWCRTVWASLFYVFLAIKL